MEVVLDILAGVVAVIAWNYAHLFHLPDELCYGIAGFSAFVFLALSKTLIGLTIYNRLVDWRFKALGTWIETIGEDRDRRYSIFRIKFNRNRAIFECKGDTFDGRGFDLFCSFHGELVDFKGDNLVYNYTIVYHGIGAEQKHGVGVSHMTFVATPGRKYFLEGKGYFTDTVPQAPFSFVRLDRETIRDLIGKRNVTSVEDRKALPAAYHSKQRASHQLTDAAPAMAC